MTRKVVALKYKPAGPVVTAFHNSESKVRVLCGPFGSGKTTAVCMEIFRRATEMPVNKDNIRRSRWVAIRTTYPELHNTTIKTWRLWFGDAYGDFSWKEPCTHKIRVPFHDGTKIELDVVFMALDGPNCEMALSGSEWSGAWLNEMKEISRPVMETVLGRLRFPPEITLQGEPWRGVIGDTNAPDDDHYLYDFRENLRPAGWDFFWQPGGVKKDPETGKWVANPDAENLSNLPKGYYESQLSALSEDKIRVNLANEYGFVKDGRPVFPEYTDTVHAVDLLPIRDLPLYVGADFGLTPAGVIAQVNAHGQVMILDEVVGSDIGAKRFGDTLKSLIATKYPGFRVADMWGDPAGKQKAQTDEVTVFQILNGLGLRFKPAPSQNPLHRREAVASALTTMIDGKPGFLVDRKCKMLRAALAGKYQYKKMLVNGERYAEKPDKNEASHIADSLQYLMVGLGKGRASFLENPEMEKPRVLLGGSRNPKVIRHKSLAPVRRTY